MRVNDPSPVQINEDEQISHNTVPQPSEEELIQAYPEPTNPAVEENNFELVH